MVEEPRLLASVALASPLAGRLPPLPLAREPLSVRARACSPPPLLSRAEARALRSPLGDRAAPRATGSCGPIHQVYPHESLDRSLDRRARPAPRGAPATCLLAHDHWTADESASELGRSDGDRRRASRLVHRRLPGGPPPKRSGASSACHRTASCSSASASCVTTRRSTFLLDGLLVAAAPGCAAHRGRKRQDPRGRRPRYGPRPRNDSRILSLLGFVPEDAGRRALPRVRRGGAASRRRGTSGSLILALSMGLPVVAADVPTVRELTRDGEAGWLFRPHDLSSLRTALERAGSDPAEAPARGRCAFEIAKELTWLESRTDSPSSLIRQ